MPKVRLALTTQRSGVTCFMNWASQVTQAGRSDVDKHCSDPTLPAMSNPLCQDPKQIQVDVGTASPCALKSPASHCGTGSSGRGPGAPTPPGWSPPPHHPRLSAPEMSPTCLLSQDPYSCKVPRRAGRGYMGMWGCGQVYREMSWKGSGFRGMIHLSLPVGSRGLHQPFQRRAGITLRCLPPTYPTHLLID